MSRSLRSSSRWQKLKLQHIQQVNKLLRVNISNRTETHIDNFKQTEFLILFGLIAKSPSNGTNGQSYQITSTGNVGKSIKRKLSEIHNDYGDTADIDSYNNGFDIELKLRKTLGKPSRVNFSRMQFLLREKFSANLTFTILIFYKY